MNRYFFVLNLLHILNDGYKASFLLLLPFIAKDFHLNLTMIGFLATLVNSLTTILAIPTGYLSGKFGGLKILFFSLFVYGIGFTITGFTYSAFFLPIIFFITAIGFGAFHTTSFALVAKNTASEKRGKQMGEFTAVGDLGKIGLSSFVTTLAGWIGWHAGAIVFGIAALAVGVASHFLRIRDKAGAEKNKADTQSIVRFRDILKNKQFIFVNISGVFDTFASSSLYIFIPFLLLQRHIPLSWLGFFTALFFVGNISGKTVLGNIMNKYGNEKVFIASEICMAVFIVILSNSSLIPIIIIASIALGIFTKGTAPIIATMVSETADTHGNFEKTFALNNLTNGAASMITPIILGFLRIG